MDQEYRLLKVADITKFLEDEIAERKRLYKNYKEAYNILYHTNTIASLISCSTGVSGIVSLPIPFATALLGGIAIGSGFIAVVSSVGNKRILKKLEKHEQIMTLALSKLSSISNIVSKALNDSAIDDREFELVLQEYENYHELKDAIKNKTRADLKTYSENIKQESANII